MDWSPSTSNNDLLAIGVASGKTILTRVSTFIGRDNFNDTSMRQPSPYISTLPFDAQILPHLQSSTQYFSQLLDTPAQHIRIHAKTR